MSKTVVSIGECMVELSSAQNELLRKGFAGDTFNTAWHLRRELTREWTVRYASAVGDDPLSDEMLAFMEASGLDVSLVRRVPGRMPGLYLIHLDGAERSFSYWRDTSAARELASDPVHLDRVFAAGDAFYVSGITLAILDPASREALLERLADAKHRGRTVAFDPNIRPRLWPDPAAMRDAIEAGARASTICLPSFPDERDAFGDADPAASARRYLALGAREAVVKDGSNPALVAFDGTQLSIAPGPVQNVVDTTGAGDSFSAGYLAARLTGASPPQAVEQAHRLAGRVVQTFGAIGGLEGA